MNHWILPSNPNSFRITDGPHYKLGSEDWWGISRYFKQIEPGDVAYIWQSIDHRDHGQTKPRGIYAKATIESLDPHRGKYLTKIRRLMREDHWMWSDRDKERHQKAKRTVIIAFLKSYKLNPLTADELVSAKLNNIGPLLFTHADIYKISDAEVRGIERLLRGR